MSELSRRYAKALFETGCADHDLQSAISMILSEATLHDALNHPQIANDQKRKVLSKLPFLSENAHLLRFFSLLLDNGRFRLLPEIATDFHTLTLHAKSCKQCKMTCVKKPSSSQLTQLKEVLCRLHKVSDIEFVFKLEPSLIDGFILEIDGVEYDHSIRHRLSDLSRYLKEVSTL